MINEKIPVGLEILGLHQVWDNKSLLHINDDYHFVKVKYKQKKYFMVIQKSIKEAIYHSDVLENALVFLEKLFSKHTINRINN